MIESEKRYGNVRELPFDGNLTPSLQSERARIRQNRTAVSVPSKVEPDPHLVSP